jgi:diguanylate cyclase (GGDEF)-like protein
LGDDLVWALAEDPDGTLWIGTKGGLTRLRGGTFRTYTSRDGLTNDRVLAILRGSGGDLWIGTDGGGLNRLEGGRFSAITTRDGLPNDTVTGLHEDAEGTLWIATRGDACALKKGGLEVVGVPAICFAEDPDGTLWMGTYGGGLVRQRHGKRRACTTRDGLYDDVIFRVLPDREGNLWLTSTKGIFRVSRERLEAFFDGRSPSVACIALGRGDGLRSGECTGGCQPAGWVARSGDVWVPSMKGVVRITPSPVRRSPVRPRVILESVSADGSEVPTEGGVRLGPGTESVEFRFTAPTFGVPEAMRFFYRLDGLDKEWRETQGARVAVYPRLPPGRYTFKVKVRAPDGTWGANETSLPLSLEPRFFQTAWFYGLAVLTLALLGYAAYLMRVQGLKVRERRLMAQVAERTLQLERANAKLEEQARRLAEANSLLEGLSYEDALTGVPNRRRFERVLDAEWRRAARAGQPLGVILADIDHFKAYNDTYGHQAGDACLRRVAKILAGTLGRAGDSVARYGGEEFVAVLAGAEGEPLRSVAEAMRQRVQAAGMVHERSPAYGVVTISLGVACVIPDEAVSQEDLLGGADAALYRAKQGGRNRVEGPIEVSAGTRDA